MTLDALLDRTFDIERYNCTHYVCDAFRELTGDDALTAILRGFLAGPQAQEIRRGDLRALRRLPAPRDHCIVLLQRPGRAPHVGIFTAGRIAHMTAAGPALEPLDVVRIGFKKVKFYAAFDNC